jgi:4-hydroxy-2-oxoheptanedioate aldolase
MRATDVNKLQEAKKTGVPILGMSLSTCYPDLAEMLGYAGVEYLFIDNEHNPASWETLANVIRACELSGIFPMLRVKKEYPGYPSNIRMAFEIGAGMVLVPHINTKEEAISVVRAAKFGPEYAYGPWPADQIRGAISDSHGARYFTIQPPEYPATFHKMDDEKRMVAIMLEEPKAFDNLEEMLSVKGIDDIQLGLGDLSVALGYPGQGADAPGVKGLLEKYERLKKKYPDKFVESRDIDWLEVITDYEKAKSKIKQGIKEGSYLFNIAGDRDILRQIVKRCKKALDEAYKEVKAGK